MLVSERVELHELVDAHFGVDRLALQQRVEFGGEPVAVALVALGRDLVVGQEHEECGGTLSWHLEHLVVKDAQCDLVVAESGDDAWVDASRTEGGDEAGDLLVGLLADRRWRLCGGRLHRRGGPRWCVGEEIVRPRWLR